MKQAGFIFIMTLITLSVITLLVLGCLNHVLMYYKAINRLEKQHQSFYQIEEAALTFANQKVFQASCLHFGEIANDDLMELLQEEGCLIDLGGVQFHYAIEALGDFACLTAHTKQGKLSTYHRRFSFLGSLNELSTTLLQIRFISPIPLQPCDAEEHAVTLGLSSWRFESVG